MKARPGWGSTVGLAIALTSFGSSCILSELTQGSGPTPGGTVTITIGTKGYTTSALAQASGEPLTIEGDSPFVTFSVTATSTATGTPLTLLKAAGSTALLPFTFLSGNHLEVHAAGMGCVATGGTMSLNVSPDRSLAGSFNITGSSAGLDGGADCTMSGTLAKVPITR